MAVCRISHPESSRCYKYHLRNKNNIIINHYITQNIISCSNCIHTGNFTKITERFGRKAGSSRRRNTCCCDRHIMSFVAYCHSIAINYILIFNIKNLTFFYLYIIWNTVKPSGGIKTYTHCNRAGINSTVMVHLKTVFSHSKNSIIYIKHFYCSFIQSWRYIGNSSSIGTRWWYINYNRRKRCKNRFGLHSNFKIFTLSGNYHCLHILWPGYIYCYGKTTGRTGVRNHRWGRIYRWNCICSTSTATGNYNSKNYN